MKLNNLKDFENFELDSENFDIGPSFEKLLDGNAERNDFYSIFKDASRLINAGCDLKSAIEDPIVMGGEFARDKRKADFLLKKSSIFRGISERLKFNGSVFSDNIKTQVLSYAKNHFLEDVAFEIIEIEKRKIKDQLFKEELPVNLITLNSNKKISK